MNTTTMQLITITRDGMPPLRFTGEKIASDSSRDHNSTRWNTVTIYRTQGGKFVAQIGYRTQWEGERDCERARSFATAAEVIDYLRDEEGLLPYESQGALTQAAASVPAFSESYVETVD